MHCIQVSSTLLWICCHQIWFLSCWSLDSLFHPELKYCSLSVLNKKHIEELADRELDDGELTDKAEADYGYGNSDSGEESEEKRQGLAEYENEVEHHR